MISEQRPPGPVGESLAALKRLPDARAAIEGVLLFLMVIVAGAWAAHSGVLQLKPLPNTQLMTTWLSAFLVPTLSEELLFRGWVRKGAPIAAVGSLLAYILWHPLQTWGTVMQNGSCSFCGSTRPMPIN